MVMVKGGGVEYTVLAVDLVRGLAGDGISTTAGTPP